MSTKRAPADVRRRVHAPGCGATRGLQAHYVRHWIDGGRTHLANLLLLCEAHHRAHHDGQFRITPLGRALEPRPANDKAGY